MTPLVVYQVPPVEEATSQLVQRAAFAGRLRRAGLPGAAGERADGYLTVPKPRMGGCDCKSDRTRLSQQVCTLLLRR